MTDLCERQAENNNKVYYICLLNFAVYYRLFCVIDAPQKGHAQ